MCRKCLGSVPLLEEDATVVDHEQRPADSPAVGRDVDTAVGRVQLHGHKLAQHGGTAQLAHREQELLRTAVHAWRTRSRAAEGGSAVTGSRRTRGPFMKAREGCG